MMVRDFQSVIGREARRQMLAEAAARRAGRLRGRRLERDGPLLSVPRRPRGAAGRRGGGGRGPRERPPRRAAVRGACPASCTAACTYLLQDEDGQVQPAHSISAGLDYPGVGPEHSWLKDAGRAEYVAVTDEEALDALALLTRLEGIIPALETAHAVAHAVRLAATLPREARLVIGLSGRGDKDVDTVRAARAARSQPGHTAGESRVAH